MAELASAEVAQSKLLDPATANEAIASRVRRYRKARGWSARELADRCADFAPGTTLSQASLSNIERGQDSTAKRGRRNVDAAELIVLATVLDIPIIDFFAESPSSCATCHGAPPRGFACQTCGASGDIPTHEGTFK